MEKRAFGLRKWKVLLSVFHVIFLVITLADQRHVLKRRIWKRDSLDL